MVLMLFDLPAKEATIAAVSAASDKPLMPVGKNANTAEYAPSIPPTK